MLEKPKIFVSYSREDREALSQLEPFLRPLERDGLIAAWTDRRLEGGDDWEAAIEAELDGATVAVLLVSQRFLASDFIAQRELPKVLAREAAGRLKVLPVFLSPSDVEQLEVSFADLKTGAPRRTRLTRFQGYGTPGKPLEDLTWSDRQREYTRLAQRLRGLAEPPPPHQSRPGPPVRLRAPAAPVAPVAPVQAFELTVQLERAGDEVRARYHLPGTEPIGAATLPWGEVREPLTAAAQVLDVAGERPLGRWLEGCGPCAAALFRLLFGPEERWRPRLRTLFATPEGAASPNPIRAPVRLRVASEDDLVLGLPWRLTAWEGRPLAEAGWSFETTAAVDPAEDFTTTAPANVLLVAPRAGIDGLAPDPGHPEAVRDLLAKVWPTGRDQGYLRVVQTRGQLANALTGMRPHVLYIYACVGAERGRPALLLDEGERLPLAALSRLFDEAGHRPAVIYLNTAGPAGQANPGRILAGVPLVLWRRLPEWTADSTSLALAWLARWLGEGEDPVAALHAVTREKLHASAEAATLGVHAGYRSWRTARYQAALARRYPNLQLDRDEQKALVRRHVEELVRSATLRAVSLVSYAAPGNAIASLWEQLRHELDLALDHVAAIRWLTLQFPDDRRDLDRTLVEELKLQLQADSNERPEHLLRRWAPKAAGPGKRPVLWLSWGTFGSGPGLQAPLYPKELAACLRFASEFLAGRCPDDLRLVSFLALESDATKHSTLATALERCQEEPWCLNPAFRLKDLPPLGKVSKGHLLEYLKSASTCPPGFHAEAARLLLAETGGEFAPTVRLLDEAENGTWYDVLSKLRREQGDEPAGADEPF